MPAMGLKTYYLNPTQKQENKSGPTVDLIENSYYRIELVDGGIKQIYDKSMGCPLLNTENFRRRSHHYALCGEWCW